MPSTPRNPTPSTQGPTGAFETLLDVPSSSYDADFVGELRRAGALASLRRVALTLLTPSRLATLKALLAAAAPGQPPLELLLTNPGRQLLLDRSAGDRELASLLLGVTVTTVTRGSEVELGPGFGGLRFIPVPTPRWPDMVTAYSTGGELTAGCGRGGGDGGARGGVWGGAGGREGGWR